MGQDTTGLNSLALYTCEYNFQGVRDSNVISTSSIGEWVAFAPSTGGSKIYIACGISVGNRVYYPNRTYFNSMNFFTATEIMPTILLKFQFKLAGILKTHMLIKIIDVPMEGL
jgi:hypothetical protein